MSSSFSSASSSSSSCFSYAYAFTAVSLFLLVLTHILKTLGGILASFWHPLDTLGATLGAIGHHLGNHVDPRVKMRSSYGAPGQLRCSIWGTFLSIFQPKLNPTTIPNLKTGFPKQSHNQTHFLFDFCAISVTPGPWFLSSRLHGSAILKKLLRWPKV